MGMFFFLTLYFAARGFKEKKAWPWHILSITAFLLGAGVKEVIVVAPALVFLYEWVFDEKKPKEMFVHYKRLYTGLFSGVRWRVKRSQYTQKVRLLKQYKSANRSL